jgi:hypothetical protein
LAALALTLSVSVFAQAEVDREQLKDPSAFFKSDDASTIFAPKMELSDKPEIQFFDNKPWNNEDKEKEQVAKAPQLVPVTQSELVKRAPHTDPALKDLPVRDRLLAAYGDPKLDAPVLAQENAPLPFKALMGSLQEGDEQLGFQYAKQYVRYVRNVQDRVSRVTSLAGLAMRREGMLTPEQDAAWKNQPQYLEDRELFEQDIAKSLEDDMKKNGLSLEGNPNAKKLIEKAIEQSSTRNIGSLAPKKVDVSQLPQDRGGQARVVFVVKLHGELADEAGEAVALFESAIGSDINVTTEVQVADEEDSAKFEAWRKSHGVKSPVSVLERSLNLVGERAPMTAVIAPSTGKQYVERGIRQAQTLVDIVKYVQGRREYNEKN